MVCIYLCFIALRLTYKIFTLYPKFLHNLLQQYVDKILTLQNCRNIYFIEYFLRQGPIVFIGCQRYNPGHTTRGIGDWTLSSTWVVTKY